MHEVHGKRDLTSWSEPASSSAVGMPSGGRGPLRIEPLRDIASWLEDYLRDRREGVERLDDLSRELQDPAPAEQARHTGKEHGQGARIMVMEFTRTESMAVYSMARISSTSAASRLKEL